MDKHRRKPTAVRRTGARTKAAEAHMPSDEHAAPASGERSKLGAHDGLASHQRNPLAPPVTITANS